MRPPPPASPRPRSALSTLRRLLLLPLLSPLLALLLLAAFNPQPRLSLRLLTLRSPALPLGLWLAAGGTAGAALSALATALALHQGAGAVRERDREREPRSRDRQEPWSAPGWARRQARDPEPAQEVAVNAGPPRAPGEPPPTLSVPFRVIRRPSRPSGAQGPAHQAAGTAPAKPGATVVTGEADDWGRDEEDW